MRGTWSKSEVEIRTKGNGPGNRPLPLSATHRRSEEIPGEGPSVPGPSFPTNPGWLGIRPAHRRALVSLYNVVASGVPGEVIIPACLAA